MSSAREARPNSLVEIRLDRITTLFRPVITYFLPFHPNAAADWVVGQSTEKHGPQVRRAPSHGSSFSEGWGRKRAANTTDVVTPPSRALARGERYIMCSSFMFSTGNRSTDI